MAVWMYLVAGAWMTVVLVLLTVLDTKGEARTDYDRYPDHDGPRG